MSKKNHRSAQTRKHIQELKRQIREIGGRVAFGAECPPEIAERFLEQVLAFERADAAPLFDRLVQAGVLLPSPDELTDDELHRTLWQVVHALALLGAYLHCTNHLSDREPYSQLWRETL